MNTNRLENFLTAAFALGSVIGASYGLALYYQAKSRRNSEFTSFWQVLPTEGVDGAIGLWTKAF
ncbi:MAG: hypothetical protein ACOYL6_09775 [Bacteriovoracaceae bacterium]